MAPLYREDRPADGGAGFFSQKVWAMSPAARLALVDAADPALSIVAQCRLLQGRALDPVLSAGAGERR